MLGTTEILGVITLCLLLVAFIYCAYWIGRKHGGEEGLDDSPYSYRVTGQTFNDAAENYSGDPDTRTTEFPNFTVYRTGAGKEYEALEPEDFSQHFIAALDATKPLTVDPESDFAKEAAKATGGQFMAWNPDRNSFEVLEKGEPDKALFHLPYEPPKKYRSKSAEAKWRELAAKVGDPGTSVLAMAEAPKNVKKAAKKPKKAKKSKMEPNGTFEDRVHKDGPGIPAKAVRVKKPKV
jgi:hypothetical protein